MAQSTNLIRSPQKNNSCKSF